MMKFRRAHSNMDWRDSSVSRRLRRSSKTSRRLPAAAGGGIYAVTEEFYMARAVPAYVILLVLAIASGLRPGLASGQAWRAPRTAWNHPDLQGVWSTATITPLERPADLAGKEFFAEEEAADYERRTLERTNRDRRDGGAEVDVARAYNDFWWDSGTRVVPTRRTALIIDPSDGRVPSLTPEAQKRQAAVAEA